jgi:hypothetical protein
MIDNLRAPETIKLSIVSEALTITVDGVGRTIALATIGSLTLLGALYLYVEIKPENNPTDPVTHALIPPQDVEPTDGRRSGPPLRPRVHRSLCG